MPMRPAAIHNNKAGATSSASATEDTPGKSSRIDGDDNKIVRLHITPFNPTLSKIYLPPSVLPLAQNISYHSIETFPEKGFGYVELPTMEAQKLKKKLNGSILKGSKVRIENAKPEKRKVGEDAGDASDEERPKKRSKKVKKENGVLEGVVLRDERKVKRGWTEPPTKNRKEKKEKKNKDKEKGKEKKSRKGSKYTKEPEMLFKAKLTPIAATEVSSKEKKDKEKKKKSKSKKEVIVHEFEKNTKQPSFLKQTKIAAEKKPAVEYINGQGWVDEDGNVVEAETGKARNRRLLELVDSAPAKSPNEKRQSATPSPKSSPGPRSSQKEKKKSTRKPASPVESFNSEDGESSVVSSSSSSEDEDSESDSNPSSKARTKDVASSPAPASKAHTPEISLTPSSPVTKEVHPLEAIFKRTKPQLSLGLDATSTPSKGLAPINTSFSFFDGNNRDDSMDVDVETTDHLPATPYTQRDLEWRGLRSAAPTPDTAAVGRRFSFPWRNGSQDAEEEDSDDDDDHEHAANQGADNKLSSNTKANASTHRLAQVAEEPEGGEDETGPGAAAEDAAKGTVSEAAEAEAEVPESEFKKWFWEKQGGVNRAWKKGRRETLKSKRLTENKRAAVGGGGGRRAV